MPPIVEPPRPPIPPENRPARLLTIDTTCIRSDAIYVNAAYEWLHQVVKRERDTDAEVLTSGQFHLALLQAPMVASCVKTGWSFRMMAGILRVGGDGFVNGWMVASHEEARDTFDMLTNPERFMEEPDDDDDQDFQPDDEEG